MKKIDNPTEYEVCKFDGVTAAKVYAGPLTELKEEKVSWRTDKDLTKVFGFTAEILTLAEIWDQLANRCPMITVIIEGPFSGIILQAGNYCDNEWYEIGSLSGYA